MSTITRAKIVSEILTVYSPEMGQFVLNNPFLRVNYSPFVLAMFSQEVCNKIRKHLTQNWFYEVTVIHQPCRLFSILVLLKPDR